MRLGIVVPTFPTRVTSSELWLAQGLAELGHEVTVFSSGREGARKDRGWSSTGSPGHPTKFRVREISTLAVGYSEASIPLRLSQIFSERPEVLLLQEDYPPLSQAVARAAHRRGVPYVVTSERYTNPDPWLARLVIRGLDRWVLPRLWRNSAALTVHSRAARSFLLDQGAPELRLRYIPSCTDVALFTPGPRTGRTVVDSLWPGDDQRLRVLTVARLHRAKGLDTLARAVAQVGDGEAGVVSLLHGRGPFEPRIRETLAELGPSHRLVIDQTSLDLADLPSLYRSADIYVQPSLTEPFGMAALEAMACGLPVVASATGGLVDLVEHGVNGLQVPAADPTRLASAIRSLVADPDRRRRMGAASRERAQRLFEMGGIARSFDGLIRTLGAGNPPPDGGAPSREVSAA